MTTLPLLEYWFRALNNPVGVAITTNDRKRMQAALYKARDGARETNPELWDIVLKVPGHVNDQLWLVHNKYLKETSDAQSSP